MYTGSGIGVNLKASDLKVTRDSPNRNPDPKHEPNLNPKPITLKGATQFTITVKGLGFNFAMRVHREMSMDEVMF